VYSGRSLSITVERSKSVIALLARTPDITKPAKTNKKDQNKYDRKVYQQVISIAQTQATIVVKKGWEFWRHCVILDQSWKVQLQWEHRPLSPRPMLFVSGWCWTQTYSNIAWLLFSPNFDVFYASKSTKSSDPRKNVIHFFYIID